LERGADQKAKKGKEMLKDFWKRLKFLLTYKPKDAKKELPQIAIDCIKQFNDVFYQNSVSERVSWFGRQVERFIKNHPSAVKYEDGVLTIDVSVTACVPGDWGDEMFNAMYSTEKSGSWAVIERKMFDVPEDYKLPERLRSKEHFVSVHWVIHKSIKGAILCP